MTRTLHCAPDPVVLARRSVEGAVDERSARAAIGQLIWMSPILRQVTGTEVGSRLHLFDDALDHLRDTMLRKAQTPPESGGLDLREVARLGEIDGWIRQLAIRVVKTSVRTARRARTRTGMDLPIPIGPAGTVPDPEPADHPAGAEPERPPWQDERLAVSKPGAALQSCARWRAHELGLPPLAHRCGPDADRLAAAVIADPAMVTRTINRILGMRADLAVGAVERALSAHLTSSYRRSDLHVLRAEPPLIAAMLVLASVTPRPRIAHVVTQTAKDLLRARAPGDPGWERVARDLTSAYVEALADVPSESAPVQSGPRGAETERAAQQRLRRILNLAARYPGAPAGDTPEAVAAALARLIIDAERVSGTRAAAAA